MYRFLLIALAMTLLLNQPVSAEDDRNGIIDGSNKTSSSFIVDPDPLDPLPVKKENIKDGDEIVLDDIRQVIDSKSKKVPEAKTGGADVETSVIPSATAPTKKKTLKTTRKTSRSKKSAKVSKNLNPDDPDMKLEDRLHNAYQKFNIEPTSTEQWTQATSSQTLNIYVVQKKDTLFTISKTLFGDSKFWPKIWALNRADILNPHQIVPGLKIQFFAGNSDSVPTVSVDQKTLDKYAVQNTEFQQIAVADSKADKSNFPSRIPDSLPLTRNGKYYTQAENRDQIDIKTFEYVDNFVPQNPFILSSMDLKSDFVVEKEQIPYFTCKENQFIPIVKKKNDDATTPGKYYIVQKLSRDGGRLKKTFKYKTVGEVTVNENNQMRVSSCRDLMNLESLIVSEEKLRGLSEPDETFDSVAKIVDGLEYPGQNYFADNQYLVISLDGLNVDNGSELKIFSDDLGKSVGTLRILRRTGTMAIAVITRTFDTINSGDKITE